MVSYIIKEIDTNMSWDGVAATIHMSLYPSELNGVSKLHDACAEQEPIHILTNEEYRGLLQAEKEIMRITHGRWATDS